MNEKVTCEDVQEMALRRDEDFIQSLEMVGEGAPNYASAEEEKENAQCKIDFKRTEEVGELDLPEAYQ